MCRHSMLRFFWGMSAVLAVCALVLPRPASAQDAAKWIVTEISGHARERGPDGNWQPLARGSVLSEGRTVETGPGARLVLMHHEDLVTVSPNSAFEVPHNSDPAVSIRFIQKLGTMLFRVEHLPQRRFEVDAPHLVAVVKGTVFTVSATKSADAVHVAEGAVQVSTLLTHQVALVRPGQVAVVSAAGRDLTILGGPKSGLLHKSKYDDPADDALGTSTADSGGASAHGPGRSGLALTHTLGDANLDLPAVSKGLLGTHGEGNAVGRFADHAGGNGLSSRDNAAAIAGNPFAVAGSPNANNPNAGGGSANAHGGNPNAGGGNANAHGGNPNAGGANAKGKGKA